MVVNFILRVIAASLPAVLVNQAAGAALEVSVDKPVAVTVKAVAPGQAEEHLLKLMVTGEDEQLPAVWIGVRITPVPAPLAAHIGAGGVMISNIVVGSPADEAGLEQYDVVVSFNGHEIDEPPDLVEAVGSAEAGEPCTLGIVRGAEPQEIEITPAERPEADHPELKYEEPEDAFLLDTMNMRGRTLQLGPDGEWIMRDLGPLKDLPQALKGLEDLDIDVDIDDHLSDLFESLSDACKNHADVRIFRHSWPGGPLLYQGDDDEDVRIEMRVLISKDGTTTIYQTDPEGKITVTRTDADGNETTETYDSPEEFEQADPEGYQEYREHSPGFGQSLMKVFPPQSGRSLLKNYSVDIEKEVKQALEQAEAARREAASSRDAARKAFEDAFRQTTRARVEVRGGPQGQVESESMTVHVQDGEITVEVTRNGDKTTYKFDSKEDFKAAEPDLYEKVKELLE
jgi:hypothetical protein